MHTHTICKMPHGSRRHGANSRNGTSYLDPEDYDVEYPSIDEDFWDWLDEFPAPPETPNHTEFPTFDDLDSFRHLDLGVKYDAPDPNVSLKRMLGRDTDDAPSSGSATRSLAERVEVTQPKQQRHYEKRNGVYKQPGGKFTASVYRHGKRFYLGSFDTYEEAARAVARYKPLVADESVYLNEVEKAIRDMIKMDRSGHKNDARAVKKSVSDSVESRKRYKLAAIQRPTG